MPPLPEPRMTIPHAASSPRRVWLALILLAIVVAVMAALGRWQLNRADERRAIARAIETGRGLPPLALSTATPAAALQPWRTARARGRWRNDLTVLVENRNLHGRPGFWVATPLQQEDGAAVLVLRGWLARPLNAEPDIPAGAPGEQHVTGELARRVPRLYELPNLRLAPDATGNLPHNWPAATTDPATNPAIPRVQNLPLATLANATGLRLVPAVLMQTAPTGDGDDTLIRDWPQPSTDADKNIGYALQWFAFAAIAATAWVVMLLRLLRRHV